MGYVLEGNLGGGIVRSLGTLVTNVTVLSGFIGYVPQMHPPCLGCC